MGVGDGGSGVGLGGVGEGRGRAVGLAVAALVAWAVGVRSIPTSKVPQAVKKIRVPANSNGEKAHGNDMLTNLRKTIENSFAIVS